MKKYLFALGALLTVGAVTAAVLVVVVSAGPSHEETVAKTRAACQSVQVARGRLAAASVILSAGGASDVASRLRGAKDALDAGSSRLRAVGDSADDEDQTVLTGGAVNLGRVSAALDDVDLETALKAAAEFEDVMVPTFGSACPNPLTPDVADSIAVGRLNGACAKWRPRIGAAYGRIRVSDASDAAVAAQIRGAAGPVRSFASAIEDAEFPGTDAWVAELRLAAEVTSSAALLWSTGDYQAADLAGTSSAALDALGRGAEFGAQACATE